MKRDKAYKKLRDDCMKRDQNQCCICGKGPKYLNLSHILPEEFTQYQYDLNNVLMLCPSHHKLGNFSFHKNPVFFIKWLAVNRPNTYWIAIDRLRLLNEI